MNSIVTKRFQQVEKLVKAMIANEAKVKFYHDFAFIRGNLFLLEAYYRTGQIQKGVNEIQKLESALLQTINRTGDVRKLRHYITLKIMFLFSVKKYSACWMEIHKNLSLLRRNKQYLSSLSFLQMMIQLELGNFTLLPGMVLKIRKKLNQQKMMNAFYGELLLFFKNVSKQDVQNLSLKTFQKLKNHPQEQELIFNTLKYEHWLQTKWSDKSLEDLLKAESRIA